MNTLMLCLCLSLNGGGQLDFGPKQQPGDRFFGEDKLQHFFVSFLVTSMSSTGARLAGAERETALWIGAGAGTAVGLVKEINDVRTEGGTGSFLDFVWDLGGVGAATVVAAQAR